MKKLHKQDHFDMFYNYFFPFEKNIRYKFNLHFVFITRFSFFPIYTIYTNGRSFMRITCDKKCIYRLCTRW